MATTQELNDLLSRWLAAQRRIAAKNTQAALDAATVAAAAALDALTAEVARAGSTGGTAAPLARLYETAAADLVAKRTADKNLDDALANARGAYMAAVLANAGG